MNYVSAFISVGTTLPILHYTATAGRLQQSSFSIAGLRGETLDILEYSPIVRRGYFVNLPPSPAIITRGDTVPNDIRLASAAVIAMVIVGFALGTLFPGRVTGALLPIAFVAWWFLYKEIKRRKL